MSKKKKKKGLLITLISILSVVVIVVGAFFIYVENYYHSDDVDTYLTSDDSLVEVSETDDYYQFTSKIKTSNAFIFYPGAKVETKAYAPLCYKLAELSITTYLVKMPFRLAVLSPNKGEKIINEDYSNWYIGGHSLGGAMASKCLNDNQSSFKGLILLASYSTYDLSELDINVLSIYGSEDGVLNKEKYSEYYKNLPDSTTEYKIEGGNHSGFAYYGPQKKDGENKIEKDKQISLTSLAISTMVYLK